MTRLVFVEAEVTSDEYFLFHMYLDVIAGVPLASVCHTARSPITSAQKFQH